MHIARILVAVMTVTLGVSAASAQPALGRPRAAGPLAAVYPDLTDARIYYYPPGKLRMASDRNDATTPDLRFLQMIYTGTSATRDANVIIGRSVLSFRVLNDGIPAEDLAAARAALPPHAQLKPLPIEQVESTIVWTPLVPDAAPTTLGNARSEESERAPNADGFWSERVFTINPDEFSSQALWSAFQNGQVMMSVACTWLAKGDDRGEAVLHSTVDIDVEEDQSHMVTMAVRSDTISVVADAAKHPALFKRIDLSASVPPGYAALDVRCWDFTDELRPDLARKSVEVRADGVGGGKVTRTATFRASVRDVYSAGLTFPFAVRLDRPFTYRVVEIGRDGTRRAGQWREGDWSRQLDITTRVQEEPR